MGFYEWATEAEAVASEAAVAAQLGCPIVLPNTYHMERWAVVTRSRATGGYGFPEVRARQGRTKNELERALKPGRTTHTRRPGNWDDRRI